MKNVQSEMDAKRKLRICKVSRKPMELFGHCIFASEYSTSVFRTIRDAC